MISLVPVDSRRVESSRCILQLHCGEAANLDETASYTAAVFPKAEVGETDCLHLKYFILRVALYFIFIFKVLEVLFEGKNGASFLSPPLCFSLPWWLKIFGFPGKTENFGSTKSTP